MNRAVAALRGGATPTSTNARSKIPLVRTPSAHSPIASTS